VISQETFSKLNTEKNLIILREYSGPRIFSVDGHVDVLGAINIGTCVIATDCTVLNAKMIVLDKIASWSWIQRIQILNVRLRARRGESGGLNFDLNDKGKGTPGFTDNKPTIIHQKEKPETNLSNLAQQPEIEKADPTATKWDSSRASKVNRHMEFNIKLIEASTRPIRSKSRPIPHSLKEQVRTAIL